MPWWVYDINKKGHPVLISWYPTESSAEDFIDKNLGPRARSFYCPNHDKRLVKSKLKAHLIAEYHDLDKGMTRFAPVKTLETQGA